MIDSENFRDAFVVDIEFGEIEIVRAWQPTDRRFKRTASSFAAINNPFEHAHVFAETRPEKLALHPFAKPVHVENERRTREAFSYIEPVLEILANIVSAKRQHRHRIASHLTNCAGGSGGCFFNHGCGPIKTPDPNPG